MTRRAAELDHTTVPSGWICVHRHTAVSPVCAFSMTSPGDTGANPAASCTGIRAGAAASCPVITPAGVICASAILSRCGPYRPRVSPVTWSAAAQRTPARNTSPRRTSASVVMSGDPVELDRGLGLDDRRGAVGGVLRPLEHDAAGRGSHDERSGHRYGQVLPRPGAFRGD